MNTHSKTGVRPIPSADLQAIFTPRTPANDIFEPEREEQPFDDPAVGGVWILGGIVAALILIALKFGGVL